MKTIYAFGRKPAVRHHTVAVLIALEGSGKRLSMCNPATKAEFKADFKACMDAGIDLLTVWDGLGL